MPPDGRMGTAGRILPRQGARSARWQLVQWLPIGLLLLAFVLRVINLGRDSFWMDELTSAQVSAGTLLEILHWNVTVGVHPPGHLILLHFWQQLAGGSEFGLRFFALLAGIATLAVGYRLAKDLFGALPALANLALLTCSNVLIYYARENRAYAWLGLAGVGAIWLARRAVWRGGGWWVALMGLLALAPYLHYYGVFVALLAAATVLMLLPTLPWPRRWVVVRSFLVTGLVAVLGYLPWVPGVLAQLPRQSGMHYFWPNSLESVGTVLASITPDLPLWMVVGVVGYALVRRRGGELLRLVVVVTVGLGAVFLANAIRTTLFPRNVLFFLPVVAILVAGALQVVGEDLRRWMPGRLRRRRVMLLPTAGLMALAVVLSVALTPPTVAWELVKPDWREVAQQLQAEATPADLILVAQWPATLTYYLTDARLTERVQDALNLDDHLLRGDWRFDQPATVWWVILWIDPNFVDDFVAQLGPGYGVDRQFEQLTVVKRTGVANRQEVLMRAGEVLEALAVARYPYEPMVQALKLRDAAGMDRQPAQRLAWLRRAVERFPDSAELQLQLGQALLDGGEREEAASALERAVALEPQGAIRHRAALQRGTLALQAGQPSEAVQWFALAIEAKRDWRFWPLIALSEARLRLQDRQGAEAALREALEDDDHPDRIAAVERLSELLRQDGRLEEARDLLARYVGEAPRDPRGWLRYGQLLEAAGEPALAVGAYLQTLEWERQGALAYAAAMGLAGLSVREREWEQALRWYGVARERMVVWSFWPTLGRVGILRTLGRLEEAEQELQGALGEEGHPERRYALAEQALLWAAQGRQAEARVLAQEVLRQGNLAAELTEQLGTLLRS